MTALGWCYHVDAAKKALHDAGYTVSENAGRLIVSYADVFETVKIPIVNGYVKDYPVESLIHDMNKWKESQK